MRGIILAGGSGTRLHPLTRVTSKQLLPIYDKPMVFYPLQTLIDSGIEDILLISDPVNIGNFVKLLGSGKDFNIKITYEVQDKPEGLAQAFLIGENFIGNNNVTMILGDNLFTGNENFLKNVIQNFKNGAHIFLKEIEDPRASGVPEFDQQGNIISIEEKPKNPKSNFAISGLYVYDQTVVAKAKTLKPSARGELEIVDLHNLYLKEDNLKHSVYQGYWLDTGTFDSLLAASNKIAELSKKNN
ncbi:MAG: spore coat protein [Candidatus Komeilibacteria bacterium CG11_big_fil_rev_8_21_14_0_20_36_20]|uniref:glucose-1-phosphate thymidylyltransferase n=1 Tax=Candidatus Komeilibacteria bacterium CG11_big_fil_rev_8_21_14_0_20_36_20 TaxID=1974477 RepID=A0A2H0NC32_9BACT|nr:MAG: spore coat protein [Candidatus Komeilibacteria bacterium CG11_big_fil_rev_8_21_14_0_20_36_20]PIR82011.1 MAG: spore coat protein [Candidatus Komeilibacteria bacterium CG10_big_fil_rev_8_21_14_0_10_36_65]PJC55549.1 MAG: spore coat protein [Candidatus Komeilibacteria bacterium CG_4_9_14_0_2_um_filter_36_13]